jgi:hypothetical protein
MLTGLLFGVVLVVEFALFVAGDWLIRKFPRAVAGVLLFCAGGFFLGISHPIGLLWALTKGYCASWLLMAWNAVHYDFNPLLWLGRPMEYPGLLDSTMALLIVTAPILALPVLMSRLVKALRLTHGPRNDTSAVPTVLNRVPDTHQI